jgi:integrase
MKPIGLEAPYSQWIKGLNSERTKGNYATTLHLLQAFLKDTPIHEVDKKQLNAWVVRLKESGLKSPTINNYMAAIRSFFSWYTSNDYRADDPSIVFKNHRMKGSAPAPKALKPEMRGRLNDVLLWETDNDWKMSLFILLGATLGLRRFELCKIRWEDIDFDSHRIRGVGKGAKPFDLNIPPSTLAKLKEWRGKTEGKYVLGGDAPLPYSKPWDWTQEIKKRMGLDPSVRLTPHVLRHNFTSQIMASGAMTIDQAMKATRHDNPETLMRYNDVEKEKVALASNKIFG